MAHEEVWGVLTCVRLDDLDALDGGMGHLAKKAMGRFFVAGRNVRESGITVEFADGDSTTIYFDVDIVLGDEPGLKEIFENKGHAGVMCCFCCKNATLHVLQNLHQALRVHILLLELVVDIISS